MKDPANRSETGEKNRTRVLVIDDEPIIGNLLEVGLSEAGFEAEYISNPEKAMEGIRNKKPDIIVSDTVMPSMDGYELRRRVREIPETANIPFIFLSPKTEPSHRLESLRYETDDYVYKPFKIDNLIKRINKMIERSERARTFLSGADFRGDLSQMELDDVIRIIGLNQRSGHLIFRTYNSETGPKSGQRKEIGRMFFQQGKLVDAQKELLEGIEAFYDLIKENQGHFEFHEQPLEGPAQINHDTSILLMKARQLAQESERLHSQLPDMNILLEIRRQKIPPEITEKAGRDKLRNILSMINRDRTVREIIHCGVMSRLSAASVLDMLFNAGILGIPGKGETRPAEMKKPQVSGSPLRPPVHYEPEDDYPDRRHIQPDNPQPGTDNPEAITRNRQPATENRKSKIRNPQPATDNKQFTAIGDGFLKVLRSFERGAMTGVLEIRDQPENAAVFIQDGTVIHAYHGDTIGKKALFRIFSEKQGTFKFRLQPISVSRTITDPLNTLLEEGNREIENLSRLKQSTFENTVTVSPHASEADAKINGRPGLRHILSLARVHSRIRDIIEASQMTDFQTYRHLFYMVKMGVFTVETRNTAGIQIVTDMSANLPEDLVKERNIVLAQGQNHYQADFREGSATEDAPRDKELNAPDPDVFHRLFQKIVPDKDILGLFLSGRLSKTCQNALAAREKNFNDYLKLRRQKSFSETRIEIVDTRMISPGLGLLVAEAADKIDEGWPLTRIREHIEGLIPQVRVFCVTPGSSTLGRRGNAGKFRSLLGYFLGLKPVLGIWNGEITMIDQVRGGNSARSRIIEWIQQSLEHPRTLISASVMHAGNPGWASGMKALLNSRLNCRNIIVSHFTPDNSYFREPGTVAVAFFPTPEDQVVFKSYGKSA